MFVKMINNERWQTTTGPRFFKTYFPIKLSKIQELIDNGFDTNDIKFVRIAPRTDTKTIVSSDSRSFGNLDYSNWIKRNLDVNICCPNDFINIQCKDL